METKNYIDWYRFFSILAFLGVSVLFLISGPLGNKECKWNEEFMKEEYKGMVVDKYIDYSYSAGKVLVFNNGDKLIIANSWFPGYYESIETGDSIYKPVGTLELKVIKPDTTLILVFDYGCE